MSEDLEPSTPSTLPALIVWKLHDLGLNPKETDMKVIRELLKVVQEERVVSDEEVQEVKQLENKLLKRQNKFRKETEKTRFTTRFCLFCFLPVLLSFLILFILKLEINSKFTLLWSCWLARSVAVVILFYLYCYNHFIEFRNSEPVQPEKEDGDDWQDSMTSTELQSRQKVLLNGWKQLEKEKKEYFDPAILFILALVTNLIYSAYQINGIEKLIRQQSISFCSSSYLTEPLSIFLVVEYNFSFYLMVFSMFLILAEGFVSEIQGKGKVSSFKEH